MVDPGSEIEFSLPKQKRKPREQTGSTAHQLLREEHDRRARLAAWRDERRERLGYGQYRDG